MDFNRVAFSLVLLITVRIESKLVPCAASKLIKIELQKNKTHLMERKEWRLVEVGFIQLLALN
jgi:hypothetical protein